MANDPQLSVSEYDVKDPNLLLRFLRKITTAVMGLSTRISNVETAPKPLSPTQIGTELKATGSAPLNVQNLLGVLRQPQVAGAPRMTTLPAGQILQQLQDTQLFLVQSTSAGYDLYTVMGGNPNSAIRLIGGLSTSVVASTSTNFMTLDTIQTSTGAKTLQGIWAFSTQIFGGPGSAAAPQYTFSTSTQSGIFSPALNQLGLVAAGTEIIHGSSSGATTITGITTITGNLRALSQVILLSPHLAGMTLGTAEELLTLSNAALFTDTTASLVPTSSLVLGVTTYVTTAITGVGVVSYSIGDPTTATRFYPSTVGLTIGTGVNGLSHWQGSVATDAAGPVNYPASKIRITCNAIPATGIVRIVVLYASFNPATS